MKHLKLIREVGNWVDDARFYDREYELERLQSLLRDGANVSIIAQRRVGKTSLMREAARTMDGELHCVMLDVQACQTAPDFFAELLRAIWPSASLRNRVGEMVSQLIGSVEKLEVAEVSLAVRKALACSWQQGADRIIAGLRSPKRPVALFIDELPIFVFKLLSDAQRRITPEGIKRAEEFLSWLRRMTLEHARHVRIVIAGSIGLGPLLHRAGLSATLNSFHPFELGPWDFETACSCMLALARNYEIEFMHGAEEQAIKLLGAPVPYFVQLFFDHILDFARRGRLRAVYIKDVREVYERKMLGQRGNAVIQHLLERLREVLDESQLERGRAVLDATAVAGALPVVEAHQLADREILNILEHDGYIDRNPDGAYHFPSLVVRDWWIRYVVDAQRTEGATVA